MTALEPVARFGGNEFDFGSFRGRSFDDVPPPWRTIDNFIGS